MKTTVGREANAKYNETKNGARAMTPHALFQGRADPYRIPGNPRSGVVPKIQDEPLGKPGDGDRNIQTYRFRLCLTKNPTGRIR